MRNRKPPEPRPYQLASLLIVCLALLLSSAPASAQRFVDQGTTVKDEPVGLVWLKDSKCAASSSPATADGDWKEAWTRILKLNTDQAVHAGCGTSWGGTWRLPTAAELATLGSAKPAPAWLPALAWTSFTSTSAAGARGLAVGAGGKASIYDSATSEFKSVGKHTAVVGILLVRQTMGDE